MTILTNENETVPVLQLAMSLDIGGVETQVVGLAKSLRAAGWPVYVASNGGRRVVDLSSSQISHYTAPLHSRSPLKMLEAAKRISALIDDLGIRIVHAHARIPAWLSTGICRRKGIKLVTTYHGTYVSGVFWNMFTKPGDLTIAVSQDVKDYVIDEFGFDPEKTVVAPNGIDTETYRPPSHEESTKAKASFGVEPGSGPVVVYASRMNAGLSATAGQVIDAISSLLAKHPRMVLIVAGDGDGLPEVRQRAERVNRLAGRKAVLCPGFVLDTSPMYQASDLVVGMSRVVLEGMAAARPSIVVGPDGMFGIAGPENHEALEDRNFTSRGAPRPSTPEAIAFEIERLLSDAALSDSLGKWGRETILSRHSMDMMAAQVVEVYETVMSGGSPTVRI